MEPLTNRLNAIIENLRETDQEAASALEKGLALTGTIEALEADYSEKVEQAFLAAIRLIMVSCHRKNVIVTPEDIDKSEAFSIDRVAGSGDSVRYTLK